jgi:hypothetical protein
MDWVGVEPTTSATGQLSNQLLFITSYLKGSYKKSELLKSHPFHFFFFARFVVALCTIKLSFEKVSR